MSLTTIPTITGRGRPGRPVTFLAEIRMVLATAPEDSMASAQAYAVPYDGDPASLNLLVSDLRRSARKLEREVGPFTLRILTADDQVTFWTVAKRAGRPRTSDTK